MCVPSARQTLFRSRKSSVRSGVLNIRAEDELHEIFVDGEFVGMTPSKLTLLEGAHLVEIKRAGCKSFNVKSGSSPELKQIFARCSIRGLKSQAQRFHRCLQEFKTSDESTRCQSATILGPIQAEPHLVVPALTEGLKDTNSVSDPQALSLSPGVSRSST